MKKLSCFVCGNSEPENDMSINVAVMLPVCNKCVHTENERKTVDEYLDSLAEGFVCGCI